MKYVNAFTALQRAVRPTGAGVRAGRSGEADPIVYYRTRTGTKYHLNDHRGSRTFFETTPEEIGRPDLQPCGKCVRCAAPNTPLPAGDVRTSPAGFFCGAHGTDRTGLTKCSYSCSISLLLQL